MISRVDLIFLKRKVLGKKYRVNLKPQYYATMKKPTVFYTITGFLNEDEVFELAFSCTKFKKMINNDIVLENKLLKVCLKKIRKNAKAENNNQNRKRNENFMDEFDIKSINKLQRRVKISELNQKHIIDYNKEVKHKLDELDTLINKKQTYLDIDKILNQSNQKNTTQITPKQININNKSPSLKNALEGMYFLININYIFHFCC